MADSPQVQRLRRRLRAIPRDVREAMQPALVQNANELADMMRRLAPDDPATGEPDLKTSIAVTLPGHATPAYSQPGGSRVAGELEAIVTAGDHVVRYAHLQEYGTAHAPAQPFFWPAVRLLQKRLKSRTKRAIAKAVRDSARKP